MTIGEMLGEEILAKPVGLKNNFLEEKETQRSINNPNNQMLLGPAGQFQSLSPWRKFYPRQRAGIHHSSIVFGIFPPPQGGVVVLKIKDSQRIICGKPPHQTSFLDCRASLAMTGGELFYVPLELCKALFGKGEIVAGDESAN